MNDNNNIIRFKPRVFSFIGDFLFIGLGCLYFYNYYYGHSIGDQSFYWNGVVLSLIGTLLLINNKVADVDLTNGSITIYKILYPKGKSYPFEELEKVLVYTRRKNTGSQLGIAPDNGHFALYFNSGKKIVVSRIFNYGHFEAVQEYLLQKYPDIVRAY